MKRITWLLAAKERICAIRIILRKTGKSTKLAVGDTKAIRRDVGSGHRHDAAASRERGHRDRIGRERDDAGRHRGLLLRASGERHGPGVLMWPDIFGLRPAFRQMGKRLAESGYSVLVVNPFYRVKKAPTADAGAATPIPQVMPLAQALNETTHMTDAKAFIGWLDQQSSVAKNRKMGTQGYCMGGPMAFRTAAAVPDRVGAVASFHGGGLVTDMPNSPHLQAAKSKAQFLIAIAANDDMRSPNDKTVLKETFAKANLPAEIEVYTGRAWLVPSGFDGLQRAAGREGMEPLARAVRKSSGLSVFRIPRNWSASRGRC
jgi:dienelactone hydrolase